MQDDTQLAWAFCLGMMVGLSAAQDDDSDNDNLDEWEAFFEGETAGQAVCGE